MFPNVMKTWPSVAAQRNTIISARMNSGPAFSASRTPLIARDDRSLAVSGPVPLRLWCDVGDVGSSTSHRLVVEHAAPSLSCIVADYASTLSYCL